MQPTEKAVGRILQWRVYPGHFSLSAAESCDTDEKFALTCQCRQKLLNPTSCHAQTPPTFLVQAEDDNVDGVNQSVAYYIALKKAGVPVEMHLYAQGGHAFGLRRTKFPITGWPQLVETWLGTIGMISE